MSVSSVERDAEDAEYLRHAREGMADEVSWQKPLGEVEVHQLSPEYTLTVTTYDQGDYWDTTRSRVTDKDGKLLHDIKRNYTSFWHCFIHHPNGNDYLLCGEVYQGYNVINLTTGVNHAYVCEGASRGFGYCWSKVTPSPDNRKILVNGCIWGFPYQTKVYDFSEPDLPLVELFDDHAVFDLGGSIVWFSPDEIVATLTTKEKPDDISDEDFFNEVADNLTSECQGAKWTLSVNRNYTEDGKTTTVNYVIKM